MTALDARTVEVLLCDADGNLFPSEAPAFEASADVTNRLLESLGLDERFTPEQLLRGATGKNFRTIASELVRALGATLEPAALERWVEEEKRRVTAHLRTVLRPDPAVTGPLRELDGRYRLAAVSSSAAGRLDACFEATGLASLFPPEARFSAEDSLPVPTSKPDPAIYEHAGAALGISGGQGLAVEDAVAGVQSAVGAGFPVLGNLGFVPPDERLGRARALLDAGACDVVTGWHELQSRLAPRPRPW